MGRNHYSYAVLNCVVTGTSKSYNFLLLTWIHFFSIMATNKYIIRPYPINKPGGVCLWRLVISTIYSSRSETTNKTISGYVSEKAVLDDIERHKKHI